MKTIKTTQTKKMSKYESRFDSIFSGVYHICRVQANKFISWELIIITGAVPLNS